MDVCEGVRVCMERKEKKNYYDYFLFEIEKKYFHFRKKKLFFNNHECEVNTMENRQATIHEQYSKKHFSSIFLFDTQ